MKLLVESITDGVEMLTEQTESGKRVYIEGPYLMAESKNRNGRVYPKKVMEQSVNTYIAEYVNERRALGELNHPERPFADPTEAAILVESLNWQGNSVIGKAQVLNTPKGQIIKALLEANFKLGVSSRGLGSMTEKANTKYVNKYMLTAIDAVDKPSAQNAYVNMIRESVEYEEQNGVWVQKQVVNQLMLENNIDRLIETLKKNSKV